MASQRPPLITTSGQSHHRATTFSWKELTSSSDSDLNQIKSVQSVNEQVKKYKEKVKLKHRNSSRDNANDTFTISRHFLTNNIYTNPAL